MGLKEVGAKKRNWVVLTQDRDFWRALVNAALNLRVLNAMELIIQHRTPNVLWPEFLGLSIIMIYMKSSTREQDEGYRSSFHKTPRYNITLSNSEIRKPLGQSINSEDRLISQKEAPELN